MRLAVQLRDDGRRPLERPLLPHVSIVQPTSRSMCFKIMTERVLDERLDGWMDEWMEPTNFHGNRLLTTFP